MIGSYIVLILFAFLVDGVFGDTKEVKPVSVMEGDSVTLNTHVTKEKHDTMRWYFKDFRIAQINGDSSKDCFYYGEGEIFKDRLKVDNETGSLIITNTSLEHHGPYEVEISKSNSSGTSERLQTGSAKSSKCNSTKINSKFQNFRGTIKSFNLTVSASDSGKNKNEAQIVPQDKESSGLSSGEVAGIVVGVLLGAAAAAGVIYFHCRKSRNDMKKNKQGPL